MILFTADWHIKLGQKNVPVAWACARYNMFFEQIEEVIAENNCAGGILEVVEQCTTIEDQLSGTEGLQPDDLAEALGRLICALWWWWC